MELVISWKDMATQLLHEYNDGSCLYRMSARSLCRIPIWKGNRMLDMAHMEALKHAVGVEIGTLDSGYKVIRYEEEEEKGGFVKRSYVVDGQHRVRVLQDAFVVLGPDVDFIVTVTEREVASEEEAIAYFNQINHAKPISYTEDDTMIANRYVSGVLRAFDGPLKLIRQGATRRPYLSADKLREQLVRHLSAVRVYSVEDFVLLVQAVNERLVGELREEAKEKADHNGNAMARKMMELRFALASDERFTWLKTLGQPKKQGQ